MSLPGTNMGSDSNPTDPDKEKKVEEEAQAGKKAQEEADDLKQKAENTDDNDEKDELLKKADEREKEARSHTKEARQIASSMWQGTVGGAGVGTGAATGTGAVVGTLVGTIATIPMAGLGALIGLPVGLMHGPFVQTGQGQEERDEPPSEEEQHSAVIKALDGQTSGKGQEGEGEEKKE